MTDWESRLMDELDENAPLYNPTPEDLAFHAVGEMTDRMKQIENKQAADMVRFGAVDARLDGIDKRLDRVEDKVDNIQRGVGESVGMLRKMNGNHTGHEISDSRPGDGLKDPTSGPSYYFALFLKYGGKEASRWVGIAMVVLAIGWFAGRIGVL